MHEMVIIKNCVLVCKYYIPIFKSYESIAYSKSYAWLSVIPVLCSTLSIIWLNESLPCWINPWNIPRHYSEKKKREIIVNQMPQVSE